MATGTNAGLLDEADPHAQSVFKHELLSAYLEPFMAMTGSTARGRRVVVLDGFAGRGRYPDGRPASAERIMKAMASLKQTRQLEAFFIERRHTSFAELKTVVADYQAQGLNVTARQGRVERYLLEVVERAGDAPLFMFLDPCGEGVSFDQLTQVLTGPRRDPKTEVLLNFSADLSRRVSGALLKGLENQNAMDRACGGGWWREVVRKVREAAPGATFEPVLNALAIEYAKRLGEATGMQAVLVPVYRKLGQQPIYHLVFFTRSKYGLWVFADAAARARQAWLRHLARIQDLQEPGTLFTCADLMEARIAREADQALISVTDNLASLLHQLRGYRLVDRTAEVFGQVYGVATESTVREAVDDLVELGFAARAPNGGKSKPRTREITLMRSSRTA